MLNHFNLTDEPWIPIVGKEPISLKQLFSSPAAEYPELGGNPIQKIALTKLLLAIAQSAYTPEDEDSCQDMGVEGLANHCLTYLDKWYDTFWLYGEKPFLQMPEIRKAKVEGKTTGPYLYAVFPDIATGNNVVFYQKEIKRNLSNAEKALLIVTLMGFALGTKAIDNKVSLSPDYKKKDTCKPGPGIGRGYLHNLVIGSNIQETLWINLLTHQQLKKQKSWSTGLGVAPWECMPNGEDCSIARELKESYLGRLVPLSRFCLLSQEGLHYSEGIRFSSHKEGGVDPSVAIDRSKKAWKAAWVDPEKRPWRMIPSFLSYLGKTKSSSFDCIFIKEGLARVKHLPVFGIWSGGLRVSSNAGEQYVSGSDDFVESKIFLSMEIIGNDEWFWQIEEEIQFLDDLSKTLYASVSGYYRQLKASGSNHARISANLFWQLSEKHSQELFKIKTPKNLRKQFKSIAMSIYDHLCPKETARQISSWVNNRSKFHKNRIL